MPSKPRNGATAVTFMLDREILTRASYMAEQLEQEHPGLRFNRFDAIRATLAKHLPPSPPGWAPKSKDSGDDEAPAAPAAPSSPTTPSAKRSTAKRTKATAKTSKRST